MAISEKIQNTENQVEDEDYIMGKYGRERERHLRENRPKLYASLKSSGELTNHLIEIDKEAKEMKLTLIDQMKKKEGVNSELQKTDFFEYLRRLQTIEYEADNTVMRELILTM